MSTIITCPSGLLSGEIRGLQGKNLSILDDRQAMQSGAFLDKMMKHCWVSSSECAYPVDKDGAPDWKKVLTGDRFYALLRVRCLMRGPTFAFQADCTRTKDCKPYDVELDLLENLDVRKLSDADREAFVAGNRLEAQLPDGTRFWFRLPTGETEAKGASMGRKARNIIPAICLRILEIEGVSDNGIRTYFEEGDLNLAFDALRAMDEHDCGVETQFGAVCPECGVVKDMEIPFDQNFLVASPKRRT
jgi:hypothetical protein